MIKTMHDLQNPLSDLKQTDRQIEREREREREKRYRQRGTDRQTEERGTDRERRDAIRLITARSRSGICHKSFSPSINSLLALIRTKEIGLKDSPVYCMSRK